ncbi:MAG: SixA phosphatase family protein [Neoaquamicrobium sediminum]|uniref:SixA phosphatase family protein n=1 Tax=Neoaquamicrobium sediminum TaxID=1849104 RepID=UPI001563FC5E|nr:histidine phosphatase family protein [Mesorhizobium sediminum]NRC55042.1 histidine phosphatase family protein [Mesorhizobium sediminum]
MSRLYLLRHAKAKWAEPGSRDYDRALELSGKADADNIAASMLLAGYMPDRVLCSGAKRARETWEAAARHLPVTDVRYMDELYSSDATGYLDIIRSAGGDGSVLVVGHNPMMEDLAMALSCGGEKDALATVAGGFPTCGLAVIRFSTPLSSIAPEDGYLEEFVAPRDL